MQQPPLSNDEALRALQQGATILALDVPEGTEFGVDLRTYSVGAKFRGMKMVPPGLHLVLCGNEIAKSGAFVRLAAGEVRVLQWDPKTEMLTAEVPSEQAERLAAAVRRLEFDGSLGPYPLEAHAQWAALSRHVDERVLTRAGVPLGTFVVPGADGELDADVAALDAALAAQGDRRAASAAAAAAPAAAPPPRPPQGPHALRPYFDGLPRAAVFVDLEEHQRAARSLRTGEARTRFHLDRSEWLGELLAEKYAGDDDARPLSSAAGEAALLGELALAFALFLTVSSGAALRQWKLLLHNLCRCEAAIGARPSLYADAIALLRAQLELAPPDFFVDELSADNFLRASLVALAGATSDASGVDARVRGALELLWRFVRERFGLDVPQLMRDEDEFADDEDMPVVEDVDGVLQVTRDLQEVLRREAGADEDPDTEMS